MGPVLNDHVQSSDASLLGVMLPTQANSPEEGLWVMVMPLLGKGPSVRDLPSTEVLRRSLGQTDSGWGLICTSYCLTLNTLLELSQTWFLSYIMGKIIVSINAIIFNVNMPIDYFSMLFTFLDDFTLSWQEQI